MYSSIFRRLSAMPGGEQEGGLRPTGLRGRLGRVQPLVSLLLHVTLGQTEQSLPAVPAGVVYPTNGEVILTAGSRTFTIILPSSVVVVEKLHILYQDLGFVSILQKSSKGLW